MAEIQQLLQEIHNCPVAASIRAGQPGPCQTIVLSQTGMTFHSPEPWSGQIATAPILFLSSNPSISEEEMYPDPSWEDEQITDFFQNRFDSRSGWVDSHLCALKRDGTRTQWVRYWAAARARASEILDKPKPGIDFVLTEVVHCKSRNQEGVREALDFCAVRFLDRVLSISAARVIIVFGEPAKGAVHRQYGFGLTWFLRDKLAEFRLGESRRVLVFLPAPGAFAPEKTLISNIGREGISIVCSYLASQPNSTHLRVQDLVRGGNQTTKFESRPPRHLDGNLHAPTSAEALLLAKELISCLRAGIKNTQYRPEWTTQNLDLLRAFAKEQEAESYPSDPNAPTRDSQFLWDFIAYKPGQGILLAAESEHDNKMREIARDFEKLLYVRSPVKLMLCRLNHRHRSFNDARAEANEIKTEMESCMRHSCDWYTPGEVFVLYCVWWAEAGGVNRDVTFLLQIRGDLKYAPLGGAQFTPA